MLYVESHSFDPEYNLSFEEYLFKYLPLEEEEYVTLWQNGPAVIIGKNQNAWAEINRDYIEANEVKVVRRITGGGAVYHDLGNLNFSFVTKDQAKGKIDFSIYYKPIVAALRAMGVEAELSGRNDITVDGKKVIGASQSIWKGRVLSNGCILFDVKMESLASALNVRPEKLVTKGIASVKARVTNIKPYLGMEKDVDDFKALLLKEIFRQFGEEPREYKLMEKDRQEILKIKESRFGRKEWNWGQSPKGSFSNGAKFPFGWVEISTNIVGGKLKDVVILGDFFGTEDVAEISKALEGADYDKKSIEAVLGDFELVKYFGQTEAKDLAELFFE
ncbi:lipoate--protein ligase [Filifactor villosus]|uniref:lipoate--protein ligase n=1 Tax=Filifactor villosus TaxID=29374 RepID=A0ABV9QKZ3_9FIRM